MVILERSLQRRRRRLMLALALLNSPPERVLVPVERFDFNGLDAESCRNMFRYRSLSHKVLWYRSLSRRVPLFKLINTIQ